MKVTAFGFAKMTQIVCNSIKRGEKKEEKGEEGEEYRERVVMALEGGYARKAISHAVEACVLVLMGTAFLFLGEERRVSHFLFFR